jgi:hypothetical protein
MQCPICRQFTPDAWRALVQHFMGESVMSTLEVQPPEGVEGAIGSSVSLDFMWCANPKCKQVVVRVHENINLPPHAVPNPEMLTRTWIARPRSASRPIDPLVQEPFRSDYLEAAAILPISPRMSAVMSRRVLADVLERYANHSQFSLKERIDKFTDDKAHPSQLRENLHHFREIADFGAHTQKDDQAEIIDVGDGEAEWTLDLLDRLFDYFIVGPEKDKQMRATMDEKLKAAGRTEIKPPEPEVPS